MNSYLQTLRNLGAARLGIVALVTLLVIGFFIYVTTRLATGEMAVLYSDLARSDSAAISKKLDSLHIPYQVNPDGTNVMVPADQVGKIRMLLAQDGLPAGGSIGYELFDQQPSFGTTSFMQNMNQLRALEGELARTVGTLAPVRQARVHLVLPKHELFSREETPASASVLLTLRPGASLGREQISAIRHLVAAAVPQLKPDSISIVDQAGNLLAVPSETDSEAERAQTNEDRRHALEAQMARRIEDIVSKTVGPGKVRATVTADMDFDRVTTNQETYDPDGQVVRSTQSVQEKNNSEDAEKNAAVTVNNNLPGGQSPGAPGNSSKTQGTRQEETVNYEISKKSESHVRDQGLLKRLSVAVLVDGTYTPGADGKQTYQPRPDADMQQINTIVKSTVGFQADRGDTVAVTNMQFVQEADEGGTQSELGMFGFEKHDLMHLAEVALLAIVSILVMLLIVRPLISRLLTITPADPEPVPVPGLTMQSAMLTDQSQPMAALAAPKSALAENIGQMDDSDTMIDIGQVEGRVRASSIRRIGEIVEKHPSEAVQILRGWMYQET